ncbi:hypothetical protein [Streptomyces sp. NPDC054940]
MTSPPPTGRALAFIRTGAILAIAGSVAALVTGHQPLMGIAAVGFALQLAGWTANRRRNTEPPTPLTIGPDDDTEEWMGERFIWEPGDLDHDQEADR